MKNLTLLLTLLSCVVNAQDVLLSENFTNGIPSDWVLKSTNERRNWFAKSFNEVNYVQMSAFGGQGKPGYKLKSELHSPLITAEEKNCKLKFSFADAYQNGQPLQVMVSGEQLQPIRTLNAGAWENLVNNSSKYDNVYEATDWIPLPKIKQPYRISFIYDSNGADNIITTIIQLKEVDIWCE